MRRGDRAYWLILAGREDAALRDLLDLVDRFTEDESARIAEQVEIARERIAWLRPGGGAGE